jgi:SAM-dependent methyltransferase
LAIKLTSIFEVNDSRVAQGVTVRRIKSVANTIPELDQMLAKRSWKTFAGLAQNEDFTISFIDREGKKQPLEVKHEVLAEDDFKALERGKEQETNFGKMRIISTEDMPLQIVDKAGLRVCELKDEYLELISASLRRHIQELGIIIQIPLPLIRNRSAFEHENEYLPTIQKYVAIEFYKAIAYKVLTQTSPQFVFEGFSHDWETNDDDRYWTDIEKDKEIQELSDKINTGKYIDVTDNALKILLTEKDKLDKADKFVKLLLLLKVDTGKPEKESMFLRRAAFQKERDLPRVEEALRRTGQLVAEIPDVRGIPNYKEKLAQAETIETAHEQLAHIQDFLVSPEKYTAQEKELVELAQPIARQFGLEDVLLTTSNVSFAGGFTTLRGHNIMALNRSLADYIGKAEGAHIDAATDTIVHELGHLLEHLMNSTNDIKEALKGGYVAHASSFTHQSVGRFAEAMKYAAAVTLFDHSLSRGVDSQAAVQGPGTQASEQPEAPDIGESGIGPGGPSLAKGQPIGEGSDFEAYLWTLLNSNDRGAIKGAQDNLVARAESDNNMVSLLRASLSQATNPKIRARIEQTINKCTAEINAIEAANKLTESGKLQQLKDSASVFDEGRVKEISARLTADEIKLLDSSIQKISPKGKRAQDSGAFKAVIAGVKPLANISTYLTPEEWKNIEFALKAVLAKLGVGVIYYSEDGEQFFENSGLYMIDVYNTELIKGVIQNNVDLLKKGFEDRSGIKLDSVDKIDSKAIEIVLRKLSHSIESYEKEYWALLYGYPLEAVKAYIDHSNNISKEEALSLPRLIKELGLENLFSQIITYPSTVLEALNTAISFKQGENTFDEAMRRLENSALASSAAQEKDKSALDSSESSALYTKAGFETWLSGRFDDLKNMYPDIDNILAKLPSGATVLTIGPGYGFEILDIMRKYPHLNIKSIGKENFFDRTELIGKIIELYGVTPEIAKKMADSLKENFTPCNLDNEDIPIPVGLDKFDAIIIGRGVAQYIKDKPGLINKVHAALKVGGIGLVELRDMIITTESELKKILSSGNRNKTKEMEEVVVFFNGLNPDISREELKAGFGLPLVEDWKTEFVYLTIEKKHEATFDFPIRLFNLENGAYAINEDAAGSPSILKTIRKKGGIDFRFLPIVTQSMDSLRSSIKPVPQSTLQRINLTQEWSDIERLVNSGITPSAERLKEYLAASCFKSNLDSDMEKIVSCISDILRMQEETCCVTDPTLKDMLVILGSGRSGEELKVAFSAV